MSSTNIFNLINATEFNSSKTESEIVFNDSWQYMVGFLSNKISVSIGSGVIVSQQIIATANHVIKDLTQIRVIKYLDKNSTQAKVYTAFPLIQDVDNDICLLKVDGVINNNAAKIRQYNTLRIGENIHNISSPMHRDLTITSGIISKLGVIDNKDTIQNTAPQSPGSSGGGLFDSNGNLIGIVRGQQTSDDGKTADMIQSLNHAIPASLLFSLTSK